LGRQLFQARHAEQSHGAFHLIGQDLDGAVDTGLAAGHQPVQVGATDQREPCAHRDRRDHVGTGHDPGVEHDLDVAAHLGDHLGQQVERDRRPIELSATVIRQQDAVDPEVGDRSRVGDRLDALDHELARPLRPDPRQVVERDRRVEHRVQEFGDRARPSIQRRERQRLRGQEVEPPLRTRDRVDHGAQRQRGRDRHPVALVPQPRTGDGHVHRHHERVVSRRHGALDERHRPVAVLPHVELKPVASERVGGLHVFDGRRTHRRQRERDARPRRRVGACDLALGVHHPGEPRRCDAERQAHRGAEHVPAGADLRHVAQDRRVELDVGEGLPRAADGQLGLGGAVGVVEGGPRRAALGDATQILDGQRLVEAPLGGVELRLLELHQRGEVMPVRQPSLRLVVRRLLVHGSHTLPAGARCGT
jgi:hypothetical protein